MLEIGQPAPDFIARDSQGRIMRLSQWRGRKVILYFYPKDMTPGCTREACDFRDRHAEIEAAGAVVLGISPDGEKSHQRFSAEYALPFPLLSDPDHAIAMAYGVWQQKSLYGKQHMGIERSTFFIDARGNIARIWRRVKVDGHGDEVLAALRV